MSDELKPCAHCGGEFEIERWSHVDWTEWRFICGRCGASSDWYTSPEQAIAAWNARADDNVIASGTNGIASGTNGITRETSVIGQQLVPNSNQLEPDSRERLEADVRGAVHGAYAYEDYIPEDMIFDWLDRQAAITEREIYKREQYHEKTRDMVEQIETQGIEIDSLTAERDKWKAKAEYQQEILDCDCRDIRDFQNEIDHLTAERDALKERVARFDSISNIDGIANLLVQFEDLTAERDQLQADLDACRMREKAAEDYDFREAAQRWERAFEDKSCEVVRLTAERDRLQKVVQVQAESFQKLERELKEALDRG